MLEPDTELADSLRWLSQGCLDLAGLALRYGRSLSPLEQARLARAVDLAGELLAEHRRLLSAARDQVERAEPAVYPPSVALPVPPFEDHEVGVLLWIWERLDPERRGLQGVEVLRRLAQPGFGEECRALAELFDGGLPSARRLGRRLLHCCGVVIDGKQFQPGDLDRRRANGRRWLVVPATEAACAEA